MRWQPFRWIVLAIYFPIVKRDNRIPSRGQHSRAWEKKTSVKNKQYRSLNTIQYRSHSLILLSYTSGVIMLLTFFNAVTIQLRRDIIDVLCHKYFITCNQTVVSKHAFESGLWPFANFCRNSDKTGGKCGANPFHLMRNQFHRWSHKWGNIRVGYVFLKMLSYAEIYAFIFDHILEKSGKIIVEISGWILKKTFGNTGSFSAKYLSNEDGT